MAKFYSDIATAQNSGLLKDRVKEGANVSGGLKSLQAAYTLAGSEAANDVLYLAKLPSGAMVIPSLSSVYCPDPGTTLTLDVGDEADADRYADAIVLSAGGSVKFDSVLPVAAITAPYRLTVEGWVLATVASASSLSAVKLNFTIVYNLPN